MGIRLVEQRACDLHEDYAEPVITGTVRLGDMERELDLCQEHLEFLARLLGMETETTESNSLEPLPVVEETRTVQSEPSQPKTRPVKNAPTAPAQAGYAPPRLVRAWAEAQGIKMSPKGRIPTEIINRYLAATE